MIRENKRVNVKERKELLRLYAYVRCNMLEETDEEEIARDRERKSTAEKRGRNDRCLHIVLDDDNDDVFYDDFYDSEL